MKKKIAILSFLSAMLISTTVLASSGYMSKSMTISGTSSGSSDIGYNTTGTARVDVNTISDTGGCTKVNVFIMNTGTGSITPCYQFQAQNTKFYSVNPGNIKAVFKRNCTNTGTMRIGYNFVYNF